MRFLSQFFKKPFLRRVGVLALIIFLTATNLSAAGSSGVHLNVSVGGEGVENTSSTTLQLFLFFTIMSLAPSLVIMMTSFTRMVIVLSFVRTALSLQQPSNQIIVALSLFLTFFVMFPVWKQIEKDALIPLKEKKIELSVAMERGMDSLKKFMLQQTREADLKLFLSISPESMKLQKPPESMSDWPINVVVPAFMISELRTAFQMGFVLFLPFLVIDMVVSSILMAMGMMMLPPVMVTLPLKLLIFVMADGWGLIVRSLVLSFQ